MPISRFSVLGSPNVGIYALATNKYVLVPPRMSDLKIRRFEKTLGVPAVRTTLGGTILLGVLATANSNGIVVPCFVSEEETRPLSSIVENIIRVESKRTALGNLVLANDQGAVIAESLYRERDVVVKIKDALGVEVAPCQIARLPYVGSFAAATNKAALVHPLIEDDEKRIISDLLKVNVNTGTVNGGSPYVHSGILVNDHGAIVGPLSAGSELMVISTIFGV
ncbi:MAG: translation initiation factor IF-6 [Candidatus Bathyarchaeia archaeon]